MASQYLFLDSENQVVRTHIQAKKLDTSEEEFRDQLEQSSGLKVVKTKDMSVGPMWTYDKDTKTFTPPVRVVARSRKLSRLAYMNKFTSQELAALYTAAKNHIELEIWLDIFRQAQYVDLDDPKTAEGLQHLVSSNIITAQRAIEILS